MVKQTPLIRSSKAYEDYYCDQAGHGLPVFIGGRGQRGRGLGSILSGIGRFFVPLFKKGGQALLREGAKTGIRIAQDVMAGQNFTDSLKGRAKEAGSRLLQGAAESMSGSGVRRRRRPAPPGLPTKALKRALPRRRAQSNTRVSKKKTRKTADIFS